MSTLLLIALTHFSWGQDWPQFQQNSQRQGRVETGPKGPYRARWIWLGPDNTFGIRPRIRSGRMTYRTRRLFISDAQNRADDAGGRDAADSQGWCGLCAGSGRAGVRVAMEDGSTKWIGKNPGGSTNTAVIAGKFLACASISGRITALNLADGTEAWAVETGRVITGSPALVNDTIYVANHGGYVYSLNAADGKVNWRVRLGGACAGGIAADEMGCYLGAEDKNFYGLNAKDGAVRAKVQLASQGFRQLWPVVYKDMVMVQLVGSVCVGSEHVFDDVLAAGKDSGEEGKNILRWLGGDDNGGKWKWASPVMKHFYVLDRLTLKEKFTVPNGPSEGCGIPADPPVVDNQGHMLLWWRTKFPKFTTDQASFGTKFTLDISAMDEKTGLRVPIDNGKFCGQGAETDNAFAFSVGGDTLFMRQRFRGTHAMELSTSKHYLIEVESRKRDGGNWASPVSYVAEGNVGITTPGRSDTTRGRAYGGGKGNLFAEPYCVTCVESAK